MLLMLVVLTAVGRYSSPWQRLMWALFAVLVIDPFATLSAGFGCLFVLWPLFCLHSNTRLNNQVRKVIMMLTLMTRLILK